MGLSCNIICSHCSLQERVFVVFFRCHSCDLSLLNKTVQWLWLHCILLLCIGFLHSTTALKWHKNFHSMTLEFLFYLHFILMQTYYLCQMYFQCCLNQLHAHMWLNFSVTFRLRFLRAFRSLAWEKINNPGMIIQINRCTCCYWLQIINGINTRNVLTYLHINKFLTEKDPWIFYIKFLCAPHI